MPSGSHYPTCETTAVYHAHMVWAHPLSLTTTQGISSISLPPATEMFHFAGFRRSLGVWITPDGLPHSDTCGSMVACTSPQLFAACHVLHRLTVPRHPPYALITLTLSLPVTCFFLAHYSLVKVQKIDRMNSNYSTRQTVALLFLIQAHKGLSLERR